jgi:acyl carrier protein
MARRIAVSSGSVSSKGPSVRLSRTDAIGMPANQPLMAQILEIFRRMGRDVPSWDTDVFEAGLLDSIGFVELLATLEREFGFVFELDDLEMDNFRSVRAIAAFIDRNGGSDRRLPAESA